MHVVIAGGNGFLGTALGRRLRARGDRVVRVVRHASEPDDLVWDPAQGHLPIDAFDGADAVVNMAGAGVVSHRWTRDYRQQLRASRIDSTALIVEHLAAMPAADRPAVFINASAIGVYGTRGDEELDETSATGDGFLAELCVDWEATALAATNTRVRVVLARTGMVLATGGGALRAQLPMFRAGLGGRLGDGSQWVSWITLDDHVGAMVHLLTSSLAGPVNLTAPNPVTNATFTTTLGKVMHRPTIARMPRVAAAAALGRGAADEVMFASQRVLPRALVADGFRFSAPTIEIALRGLLP